MKIKPFIGILAVTLLLGAGCGSQKTKVSETGTPSSDRKTPQVQQQPSVTINTPQAMPSYTVEEVTAHATSTNCWMIISDKVYDVTPYISKHPGGNVIVDGCGKEATAMFQAVQKHSGKAESILANYEIGSLSK